LLADAGAADARAKREPLAATTAPGLTVVDDDTLEI